MSAVCSAVYRSHSSGVVVPPDDYDHWAPKSDASADTTEETLDAPRPTAVADGVWSRWEGEAAARPVGVIPHSRPPAEDR